jgi:hypothetical protein
MAKVPKNAGLYSAESASPCPLGGRHELYASAGDCDLDGTIRSTEWCLCGASRETESRETEDGEERTTVGPWVAR